VTGQLERPSKKAAAEAAPAIVNDSLNRSKAMQLMHEDMARAHSALRLEELLRHERSRRVVAAHRAQRRAERSVARAQRLLALASIR
jgi:hypothetical protein